MVERSHYGAQVGNWFPLMFCSGSRFQPFQEREELFLLRHMTNTQHQCGELLHVGADVSILHQILQRFSCVVFDVFRKELILYISLQLILIIHP